MSGGLQNLSSDFDWLKERVVAKVEEVVQDQQDEKRLDGDVNVWYDYEN